MNLDQLIRKYNVTGPRYTSYPTALQMEEALDVKFVWDRAATSGISCHQPISRNGTSSGSAAPKDFALYIHLPFCRSLCWYCGCNKVISRNQNDADLYLDFLEKEIRLIVPLFGDRIQVSQLHLGGGTPTFLSASQLMRLMFIIRQNFTLSDKVSCSVEMDPRQLTRSHVRVLKGLGFTRASIGVQDLSENVQKLIHRIQPFEQNRRAVDWLRENHFDSINVDLVYGLPGQTPESFSKSVDQILTLNPDRLAVYNYAHLPSLFPAQRLIDESNLPTADVKIDILTNTITRLLDAGYEYIGMDHFARPGDSLSIARQNGTLQRNFQGYDTHAGTDMIAFGVSSISQVGRYMIQNHKDLQTYYDLLDSSTLPVLRYYTLTDDDCIRRDLIMSIMCKLEVNWDEIDRKHHISSREYFADELRDLETLTSDQLIEIDADGFWVTDTGRYFLRNIAMIFDTSCRKGDKSGKFSKTV